MGIREVSQAEIWSKETSRKILSRVWKVLKWAGISIGTVVAALALFVFVWTHWLTAKERNAGTTALAQIDALSLTMNRVRQAAITKEIIEIVSGAAAL